MLTESLSAEIEQNFYSRCPPEKRPKTAHDTFHDASTSVSRADSPQVGKNEKVEEETSSTSVPDAEKAEIKSRKGAKAGRKSSKEPKQDSSLLMALHNTFFWPWWMSGLLKLASGTSRYIQPI